MKKQESEYVFEEKNNLDGTVLELMKTLTGIVVSESLYDGNHLIIERRDYDATGSVTNRVVYEQDGQRKPLKTTSYDHKGNVIFIQERGKPPIFHGEYKVSAPSFMRAKT
jgi:hypothetical protein